jgi:hypothetical protein
MRSCRHDLTPPVRPAADPLVNARSPFVDRPRCISAITGRPAPLDPSLPAAPGCIGDGPSGRHFERSSADQIGGHRSWSLAV